MHRIRTILQARISDRILSAAEHMVSSRKDFDGTILMILAAPGMSGKEILVRDLSASSALAAYRGRMPTIPGEAFTSAFTASAEGERKTILWDISSNGTSPSMLPSRTATPAGISCQEANDEWTVLLTGDTTAASDEYPTSWAPAQIVPD